MVFNFNKQGQSDEGMKQIVLMIIAILVLVFMIVLITNPSVRDFVKNLPSYGAKNGTNVDEVIVDEIIPDANIPKDKLCPDEVGSFIRETYYILPFWSKEVYKILGTPLWFEDAPTNGEIIKVSKALNPEVGVIIEKNGLLFISLNDDKYSEAERWIKRSYWDKLNGAFIVNSGGIKLCKERL